MDRGITEFVAALTTDDRVRALLELSVGRVLRRVAGRGGDWREMVVRVDLHHIADWLWAAVRSDAPWLSKNDELGRPVKLMKFGSLSAMEAEADKATKRFVAGLGRLAPVEGEKEWMRLGDGYSLVRLSSAEALDRESSLMGHCIGQGAYDDSLDGTLFLSLRDGNGGAHATLQVHIKDNALVEIKGKLNRRPNDVYMAALKPFFQDVRFSVEIDNRREGYVIDRNGDWFDLDRLPAGLDVRGSLKVARLVGVRLPSRMSLTGDLDLRHTQTEQLPHTLDVGGCLVISGCSVRTLPENLTVGLDLFAMGSGLAALPEGLHVGGDLWADTSALHDIPESVVVEGFVHTQNIIIGLDAIRRGVVPINE
jgi:hypothetical protein